MQQGRRRPRAVLGIGVTRQSLSVVGLALLLTCLLALSVVSWLERSA